MLLDYRFPVDRFRRYTNTFSSVQFSSVTQSCPTLCDPMNRSMPGLPVHHQLLEFTQTHVHRVSDAIQPSHPLSSPSPPALKKYIYMAFKWITLVSLQHLFSSHFCVLHLYCKVPSSAKGHQKPTCSGTKLRLLTCCDKGNRSTRGAMECPRGRVSGRT